MEQVRTELKRTGSISLNDTDVRKLAGRTSGTISMADLRGKKASENVENYQIYNNSWRAVDRTGSFTVDFPHKVISGTLIVTSTSSFADGNINSSQKGYAGYITINSIQVKRTTKNISISNISSILANYYTGYIRSDLGSGDIQESASTVTVDIKFTGEWEL